MLTLDEQFKMLGSKHISDKDKACLLYNNCTVCPYGEKREIARGIWKYGCKPTYDEITEMVEREG